MKPFFTDQQVRKFTLKEKFEFIFKKLNFLLQPVSKKRTETICWYPRKTITYLDCSMFDENGINLINDIELPFTDMKLKTKENLIEIIGEKFCYVFPPEAVPEVWRRLKKML